MINEAIVVMTIFGCGDAIKSCDYVSTQTKTWTSIEACEREIPSQLMRMQGEAYPTLTANCDVRTPLVIAAPLELPQKSMFDVLREKSENTNIDVLGSAANQIAAVKDAFTGRIQSLIDSE